MIINFNNLVKYYGSDIILNKISGIIDNKSRIGIIGANGAGKTTLLKLISGVETPDSGTIYINPNVKLGYLTQNLVFESCATVFDEMLNVFEKEIQAIEQLNKLDLSSSDGKNEYDRLTKYISARDAYNIDVKINYVLNGMGFTEKQKSQSISTLSGGEKTRLAISKLLLCDANVLLLDEPTNHLDFKTCAWLEEYLKNYGGAVISVTHDRYYLDKVCTEIWEIEYGKLNVYRESYSSYKKTKAKNLELVEKAYKEQNDYINKLEDYISKNIVRASTSKMAKSRQKELDRIERIDKPREYNKQINIKFKFNKKSWFDVLKLNNLSVSAGGMLLFSDLCADIKAGEKIAVIGDNGAGKSTLFKVLVGSHKDYTGKFLWGKDVSIGLYEQNHEYKNPDKTVRDELWDMHPATTEHEIRSHLASLLFTSDDIYKKTADISGGESARLQLAIMTLQDNNTLLMDEPTNHLDMMSKEKLESALMEFPGTELIISHDRYLLNKIPDKIIYIAKDKVTVFNGKFDEFLSSGILSANNESQIKEKVSQNSYKSKKDRINDAKKRTEISNCEKEIAELEKCISQLEKIISENSSNYETLTSACSDLELKKHKLDVLTERWLELSE